MSDLNLIFTAINLLILGAMAGGIFYMRRLAFQVQDDLADWKAALLKDEPQPDRGPPDPDSRRRTDEFLARILHEGKVPRKVNEQDVKA